MTSLPLKRHLLSTEVDGKDCRIICMQNWTLAYALYTIAKCKVLFIRRLMRTSCYNSLSSKPQAKRNIQYVVNNTLFIKKKKQGSSSSQIFTDCPLGEF